MCTAANVTRRARGARGVGALERIRASVRRCSGPQASFLEKPATTGAGLSGSACGTCAVHTHPYLGRGWPGQSAWATHRQHTGWPAHPEPQMWRGALASCRFLSSAVAHGPRCAAAHVRGSGRQAWCCSPADLSGVGPKGSPVHVVSTSRTCVKGFPGYCFGVSHSLAAALSAAVPSAGVCCLRRESCSTRAQRSTSGARAHTKSQRDEDRFITVSLAS